MSITDHILNKYYTILIKPIALGSKKKLAFGFTDYNNQTQYLSKNVRNDWFLGKEGFINTMEGSQFQVVIESGNTNEDKGDFQIIRRVPSYSSTGGGYIYYDSRLANFLSFDRSGLKFFVEDETGEKYYVASRDLNIKGSLPYGLLIPTRNIECYPYERQNIDKVFSNFKSWVNNKGYLSWYYSPYKDNSYVLTNEYYFNIPERFYW